MFTFFVPNKVKTENLTDPLYIPDDLSTSSEDFNQKSEKPKRRQRTDKKWKKERVFENKKLALEAVKHEDTWGFIQKNVDTEGSLNEVYRCKKVKVRGEQCKAGIYLNYPSHNHEVILYRSQLDHTCHEIATKAKPKMSDLAKLEVRNLLKSDPKIKPKKIMEELNKKKMTLPKLSDINNYLAILRRNKSKPNLVNIDDFERFCMENSKIPEDENKAFIVSYQVEYDEPTCFRFFVSSKTLLKSARNANHVHADATHKLTWQGLSILIIGTTDRNCQFHVFGIGVCTAVDVCDFIFIFSSLQIGIEKLFKEKFQPKTLISDSNHRMQVAFKNVFGSDCTIITCWVHMKRNFQKIIEDVVQSKEDWPKLLADVDLLQVSKNEEVFNKVLHLFLVKWEKYKELIEYIKFDWCKFSRNWYWGIKNFIPCTNNGLEAWVGGIINDKTFRQRLPLGSFTEILTDYIKNWSNDYTGGSRTYNSEPVIGVEAWCSSKNWRKLNNVFSVETLDTGHVYLSPSDDRVNLDDVNVEKLKGMEFKAFEEYKEVISKFYTTVLPLDQNNWSQGVCDCPLFFKNLICKHIIGLAIQLNIIVPPPEFESIPLGKKMRRGRPCKPKIDNVLLHFDT